MKNPVSTTPDRGYRSESKKNMKSFDVSRQKRSICSSGHVECSVEITSPDKSGADFGQVSRQISKIRQKNRSNLSSRQIERSLGDTGGRLFHQNTERLEKFRTFSKKLQFIKKIAMET